MKFTLSLLFPLTRLPPPIPTIEAAPPTLPDTAPADSLPLPFPVIQASNHSYIPRIPCPSSVDAEDVSFHPQLSSPFVLVFFPVRSVFFANFLASIFFLSLVADDTFYSFCCH